MEVNGKTRIEKCSADTLYRIAKALGVTIESLIGEEIEAQAQRRRTSFEVYKSNVCHLVKDKGDIDFVLDVLSSDEVRKLYNRKWYAESFYLLAMIDYLSRENDIPRCTRYDDIRGKKLKKVLFPASVLLIDQAMNTDEAKEESLREAIPEFMNFNIVEAEVRNVC